MNITRYLLPASIAAVVHTALLLAFPGGPHLSGIIPLEPGTPPAPVRPVDPPPAPSDDEERTDEPVAPVNNGVQRPEIPDLAVAPVAAIFTIEVQPVVSRPDPYAPLGPPGVPGGIGTEYGINRPATFIRAIDLDRMPRAIAQMPPDYPSRLKTAGIGGQVIVEFAVDSTGRVTTVRVLKSTQREFDEPTLRAILKWRFEPGKRNGRVVPFRMTVPVDFSVGGV